MAECCAANENVSSDLPAEPRRMFTWVFNFLHYHAANVESWRNQNITLHAEEVFGCFRTTGTLWPLEMVREIVSLVIGFPTYSFCFFFFTEDVQEAVLQENKSRGDEDID